jgi:hypothetical protein
MPVLSVILFEPNPVVALDVTQALATHQPPLVVVVAPSLADALHMAAAPGVLVALLHAGPDALAQGVPSGVHVVLMGDAAEDRASDWPVLRRPFTTEDLHKVLDGSGWSLARQE